MFNVMANALIDTIQGGKKQFVAKFVTNDELAKVMEEFVDAQTAYTKAAVATAIDTTSKLAKLSVSKEYFGGK
jgi:predicted phage gp36 major capsid-like protein